MPKPRTKQLPKKLMSELMADMKRIKSFIPKLRRRKRETSPTRIPEPDLPTRPKVLSKSDQWRSLLWLIDTAEAHGKFALQGLTITLARKIQADGLTMLLFDARQHRSPHMSEDGLLWPRDQVITRDGKTLQQLAKLSRRSRHVQLSSTAMIANVWERWRLTRALQMIGPHKKQKPWKQDNNHHATLWYPWPLVWVDNGNHSTTAAAINGGGNLKCDAALDLSPFLRIISTDGINWYGEDNLLIGPVESLAMAGIIEIGKRLIR